MDIPVPPPRQSLSVTHMEACKMRNGAKIGHFILCSQILASKKADIVKAYPMQDVPTSSVLSKLYPNYP